ncbi:MAG: SDR family NAD(P)-dependent oxidoreductase [Clostridia bacterium]|jgi:UDP-N-acetylglucosamine 4,6-dehydratase
MDFTNKVILVTGGSGSFGSNFIRHFLKARSPRRIRIYSRDEHKQADLLSDEYYGGVLDGFIGDVRDKDRLRRAMEGVDIVVHAAALKRVQACEYNPFETVKTNIIGSMNVVDCALDAGVEKVLAVSSDKAVAPLNLYGATKMCMEKLIINANNYRGKGKTKFCCVRYGNVAGSKGSVVPAWKELSVKKIPIPINNPNATRFWFDMKDVVTFATGVLEQMDYVSGGEIFVPKLPSVKIMDLFHAMFEHQEFTINGDRVGDKLHETMILADEMKHTIDLGDKYIILPQDPHWEYVPIKGEKCNGRPSYDSGNNSEFLSINDIKERLSKIG